MSEINHVLGQSFHLVPISFPLFQFPAPKPRAYCTWAWGFFKSLLVITEGECSSINCHGIWCCILLTIYSDWEVSPALKRNLKGNVMMTSYCRVYKAPFVCNILLLSIFMFQRFLDCSLEFWNLSVQNITMS